jgi:hypothetical protein
MASCDLILYVVVVLVDSTKLSESQLHTTSIRDSIDGSIKSSTGDQQSPCLQRKVFGETPTDVKSRPKNKKGHIAIEQILRRVGFNPQRIGKAFDD